MRQRRFLVASSFARLIRKERGTTSRIVEGYFPPRPDRDQFVSIEPGQSYLVLKAATQGQGTITDERTEVPRSQATALLEVCVGKVGYERTTMQLLGGTEAVLDHVVAPGLLDVLSVEFSEDDQANAFIPPAWFGPDVTHDTAFSRGSLARDGIPATEEVPLSNAMLDELLNVLEGQFEAVQLSSESVKPVEVVRASEQENEAVTTSEADQPPPASAGGASSDTILPGLERALEGSESAEVTPTTGTKEVFFERSRPRVEARQWRR